MELCHIAYVTHCNLFFVAEVKIAVRKAAGLTTIAKLMNHKNENIVENAVGALRNCVVNDQNKVAIREQGVYAILKMHSLLG